MVSAIGSGYNQTQALMAEADPEGEAAAKLEKAWASTSASLNAMAAYADALARLAEVGHSGQKAGNALADAVSSFTSVVGLGPIPGAFAAAFGEINKTIAQIRARDKLSDAVEAAQPAIAIVAKIVEANLADLENLEQAAGLEAEAQLTNKNRLVVNYYESLRAEEDRLLRKLTLLMAAKAGDRESLAQLVALDVVLSELRVKGVDPTARHAEDRQPAWLKQASDLRAESALYRPEYHAYVASVRRIG